ncbi:hypothetical protein [Sphingomonas humi]|uniref:hypothetical protein n=1 Tax=Sphingomonas humi TaxID=335630 RepID=UPI0031DE17DB
MSFVRFLYGLLVVLTGLVIVFLQAFGGWNKELTWRDYSGPAIMVLLCIGGFFWLRRQEV